MGEEKRKIPRIEFRLKVTINDELPGKMMNFCTGGAFIHTDNPSQFKAGDEEELAMKFPLENKPSKLKARVAHVTSRGIGVEFQDLSLRDTTAIDYCYDVFEHTLPFPGT